MKIADDSCRKLLILPFPQGQVQYKELQHKERENTGLRRKGEECFLRLRYLILSSKYGYGYKVEVELSSLFLWKMKLAKRCKVKGHFLFPSAQSHDLKRIFWKEDLKVHRSYTISDEQNIHFFVIERIIINFRFKVYWKYSTVFHLFNK